MRSSWMTFLVAHVRVRLWWVNQSAARRSGIVIAALAVSAVGISAVVFVRHRMRAHEAPSAPQVAKAFEPTNTGDAVASYLRQVANGATCAERREAVISLGNLADRRALQALRRARSARGLHGFGPACGVTR
jgi:hypothetical protein